MSSVESQILASEKFAPVCDTSMLTLSVAGKPLLQAYEAKTFFSRLRGLHAYLPLTDTQALVITRCHSIHTFTLRQPIDVLFVSDKGVVLELESVPVRRCRSVKDAACVIEMNEGVALRLGIAKGSQLERDSGDWL